MATAELLPFEGGGKKRKKDMQSRAKLGNFVHGQLKQKKVEFDNFKIYEGEKDNRQIMVAETENMTYVGKNFGEDSSESDFQRTYLGVYNPKTGKMKIVDVDLFKFKPYCPEIEDDKPKEDQADISYIEQNDLLTSAFGSKRKRRAMEDRKKNLVVEETLKKVLDSTVKEGKDAALQSQQKLDELVKADDALSFILPPYTKDADKVQDIFKITDVISETEMEMLTEPAKELAQSSESDIKQWIEENKYSLVVLKHLNVLPSKEEEKQQRCKYLLYLHYMIVFFKTSKKSLVQSRKPLPEEWPAAVKKRLLELFTGPPASAPSTTMIKRELRSYTKRLEDRLLSHILILALIIGNFKMELADIVVDTQVSIRRLITHSRMIGLKILKANKPNMSASLKAPLNFVKRGTLKKMRT